MVLFSEDQRDLFNLIDKPMIYVDDFDFENNKNFENSKIQMQNKSKTSYSFKVFFLSQIRFFVFLYTEDSVELPMANSSMFARPINSAPAFLRRVDTVESYVALKFSIIFEAHEEICPSIAMLSFKIPGMPESIVPVL